MVSLRNLFEFFRMLFVTKIIINQEIGKDQKGEINEREVELQKYIYALKKKKGVSKIILNDWFPVSNETT